LAVSILLVPKSDAAEYRVSGSIVYDVTYHNETKLEDGTVISRDHLRGTIDDSDDQGPVEGSSHDCFGAIVFVDGGKTFQEGHGSCDGVTKDGDVWWLSWSTLSAGKSEWTITGGTGKFAGATGSGTTTFKLDEFKVTAGQSPSRLPNTYEGVLTLR
jgi:hypothetical protein